MNEQMKLLDPETGEVSDLPHQGTDRQARLFAKLAHVMGELKRLPKRGYNKHFEYAFVTDADVLDTIRSLLAAEGLAFFASIRGAERVVIGQDKAGRDRFKTIVYCNFTFAEAESGATWTCDWQGEAIDDQDKGTAKAATSALKYFLLKNFMVGTGNMADDSDADGEPRARGEKKPEARRKAMPQKPATPAEEAGGNGADGAAQFFADVLIKIPYYNHVNHVKNTLKGLGYASYKKSLETEMFQKLQEHATAEANQAAAQ